MRTTRPSATHFLLVLLLAAVLFVPAARADADGETHLPAATPAGIPVGGNVSWTGDDREVHPNGSVRTTRFDVRVTILSVSDEAIRYRWTVNHATAWSGGSTREGNVSLASTFYWTVGASPGIPFVSQAALEATWARQEVAPEPVVEGEVDTALGVFDGLTLAWTVDDPDVVIRHNVVVDRATGIVLVRELRVDVVDGHRGGYASRSLRLDLAASDFLQGRPPLVLWLAGAAGLGGLGLLIGYGAARRVRRRRRPPPLPPEEGTGLGP